MAYREFSPAYGHQVLIEVEDGNTSASADYAAALSQALRAVADAVRDAMGALASGPADQAIGGNSAPTGCEVTFGLVATTDGALALTGTSGALTVKLSWSPPQKPAGGGSLENLLTGLGN
jgi:hypothetical protein